VPIRTHEKSFFHLFGSFLDLDCLHCGLGYVVKTRLTSDLLPAIRAAMADRRFVSPAISLEEKT
jgi:hypothetical protein